MSSPCSEDTGASSSSVKGNEKDRLVRCKICGFPCDKERDVKSKDGTWAGLGISYSAQLTAGSSPLSDRRDSTGVQVGDNYYTREVVAGCPCCSSLLYWE